MHYPRISTLTATITFKASSRPRRTCFRHRGSSSDRPWRAVPLRLLWATEHHDTFTKSIDRAGSAPPWPDRYIQDRESFAFFVSGLSTIEVACYAIYAVGSIVSPPHFPILLRQDLRRISPESTNKRLKSAFPNESLSISVHSVITDALFKEWKLIRNSLIHHCAPAHTINVGAPEEDDLWNHQEFSIPLNAETTQNRHQWLVNALNELESELYGFVHARLR
jgi:hypothetical protein